MSLSTFPGVGVSGGGRRRTSVVCVQSEGRGGGGGGSEGSAPSMVLKKTFFFLKGVGYCFFLMHWFQNIDHICGRRHLLTEVKLQEKTRGFLLVGN